MIESSLSAHTRCHSVDRERPCQYRLILDSSRTSLYRISQTMPVSIKQYIFESQYINDVLLHVRVLHRDVHDVRPKDVLGPE